MAWHARVLVIANVTANSPDLLAALKERADRGPIDVTLVNTATRNGFAGREEAQGRLRAARARPGPAHGWARGLAGGRLRAGSHRRRPGSRRRSYPVAGSDALPR